jgi:hypothetical protein
MTPRRAGGADVECDCNKGFCHECMTRPVCQHGSLRRSCDRCEDQETIDRLTAERDQYHKLLAIATDGMGKAEAERDALRAECNECGGDGTVTEPTPDGSIIDYTHAPCPKCAGAGRSAAVVARLTVERDAAVKRAEEADSWRQLAVVEATTLTEALNAATKRAEEAMGKVERLEECVDVAEEERDRARRVLGLFREWFSATGTDIVHKLKEARRALAEHDQAAEVSR